MLGPTLFIIFINDLPNVIKSNFKMYADDAKIMNLVKTQDQANQLQEDLDRAANWASENACFFNAAKCSVMHFGANNPRRQYHLNAQAIGNSEKEKDLGVMLTPDLKSKAQVNYSVSKASFVLSKIKQCFSFFDVPMVNQLFKTFVRPHLEFAVAAWSPCQETDIEHLERVQRKASKLVHRTRHLAYELRLEALKWSTLKERRVRGDLIQWHKILHGHEIVHLNQHHRHYETRSYQGPAANTRLGRFGIERELVRSCKLRHTFLPNRVSTVWNQLPLQVREEKNTNHFKVAIDKLAKKRNILC